MEIGSLCLNPCGYLNPMTALARRVAIGRHEVFFFTELEKRFANPTALSNYVPLPVDEGNS
jgi:hypothetical protein